MNTVAIRRVRLKLSGSCYQGNTRPTVWCPAQTGKKKKNVDDISIYVLCFRNNHIIALFVCAFLFSQPIFNLDNF